MKLSVHNSTLELVQGDITKQQVEAIVNAANSALGGGGGVDGAIHRAAGPSLLTECRQFKGGCPAGQAVITGAGLLPAKHVIHAVGPVWYGGDRNEDDLLASAYRTSLELAAKAQLSSIAFPAISTGAYRFPIERAAGIAIDTACQFCESDSSLALIRFVVFSDRDNRVYAKVLGSRLPDPC